MKICKPCNQLYYNDVNVCPVCGTALEHYEEPVQEGEQNSSETKNGCEKLSNKKEFVDGKHSNFYDVMVWLFCVILLSFCFSKVNGTLERHINERNLRNEIIDVFPSDNYVTKFLDDGFEYILMIRGENLNKKHAEVVIKEIRSRGNVTEQDSLMGMYKLVGNRAYFVNLVEEKNMYAIKLSTGNVKVSYTILHKDGKKQLVRNIGIYRQKGIFTIERGSGKIIREVEEEKQNVN